MCIKTTKLDEEVHAKQKTHWDKRTSGNKLIHFWLLEKNMYSFKKLHTKEIFQKSLITIQ